MKKYKLYSWPRDEENIRHSDFAYPTKRLYITLNEEIIYVVWPHTKPTAIIKCKPNWPYDWAKPKLTNCKFEKEISEKELFLMVL